MYRYPQENNTAALVPLLMFVVLLVLIGVIIYLATKKCPTSSQCPVCKSCDTSASASASSTQGTCPTCPKISTSDCSSHTPCPTCETCPTSQPTLSYSSQPSDTVYYPFTPYSDMCIDYGVVAFPTSSPSNTTTISFNITYKYPPLVFATVDCTSVAGIRVYDRTTTDFKFITTTTTSSPCSIKWIAIGRVSNMTNYRIGDYYTIGCTYANTFIEVATVSASGSTSSSVTFLNTFDSSPIVIPTVDCNSAIFATTRNITTTGFICLTSSAIISPCKIRYIAVGTRTYTIPKPIGLGSSIYPVYCLVQNVLLDMGRITYPPLTGTWNGTYFNTEQYTYQSAPVVILSSDSTSDNALSSVNIFPQNFSFYTSQTSVSGSVLWLSIGIIS